jgi:hypothetical protein
VPASSSARPGRLTDNAIPGDVRRLVQTRIRSISELELLFALRRDHARGWSVDEAAGALDLDHQAAERMLFDLMARGLLTVSRVTPLAYQFNPTTHQLRATIDRLAELYATRRPAVMHLVLERPDQRLRLFSGAEAPEKRQLPDRAADTQQIPPRTTG